MGLFYSDNFNRGDSADLGTEWDKQSATGVNAQIVGQRIRSSLTNSSNEESANVITTTGECFAMVTIATFTGAGVGDAGVLARAAVPLDRTFYYAFATKNPAVTTL